MSDDERRVHQMEMARDKMRRTLIALKQEAEELEEDMSAAQLEPRAIIIKNLAQEMEWAAQAYRAAWRTLP